MKVNHLFLMSNPFFDAYLHSDYLGKLIFISLLVLSICSWIIIIHKIWILSKVRGLSQNFKENFATTKDYPLQVECPKTPHPYNPFLSLYLVLKKHTVELLNKNHAFAKKEDRAVCHLSPSDIDLVASHLVSAITLQTKNLEKHLYVLSTVVSLAPFLGLLGTVWGILITFSELQSHTGGMHNMVLGGLSLALATTVLGLLDAIPALVGYNYLKNAIHDYHLEMENFSTEILASVEMQYRKVDV